MPFTLVFMPFAFNRFIYKTNNTYILQDAHNYNFFNNTARKTGFLAVFFLPIKIITQDFNTR